MATIPEILEQVKTLISRNQKAEALALLQEALRKWPDQPLLMLWYAGLTPDLEQGIRLLERVLELEPNNIAAQKGLADLRRKWENAHLQATAASSPTSSQIPVQVKTTAPEPSPAPPAQPVERSTAESSTPPSLLEIAGKTIWPFRNLNAPIRDLVEAEKITIRDLLWAAENAQQVHLRWASAVYLRHEKLAQMSMTPDELSTVIWPFRGINRPITEAIQTGQVTMQDLLYATLHAREPRLIYGAALAGYLLLKDHFSVPQKAETASTPSTPAVSASTPAPAASPSHQASQPPSPNREQAAKRPIKPTQKGPLVVIEGSPYLKKQREIIKKKAVFTQIISIGLLIAALASILLFPNFFALPLILLGIALFITRKVGGLQNQEENLAQGIAGEEAFVSELRKHLNSDWKLFRNIDLPDRSGDLDAVLVGPKGIYLLEIKAYNMTCRNIDDRWEYQVWGKWKPLAKNPTQQALRNAARLNEHLKEFIGQDAWVEPRIVWAGRSKLYLDRPRVKVWYLPHREYWLRELQNGKRLPPEKVAQIVASLRTLCAVNRSEK